MGIRTPKTVDGVMDQFIRAIDQLRAIRDTKIVEEAEHNEKADIHRAAARAAQREAERAEEKAKALNEVFG